MRHKFQSGTGYTPTLSEKDDTETYIEICLIFFISISDLNFNFVDADSSVSVLPVPALVLALQCHLQCLDRVTVVHCDQVPGY